MISMTGYASREINETDFSLSVEIRSYNNRYLEISLNIPPWLSAYEQYVREYIADKCYRGKVEVSIYVREHKIPVNVSVNFDAAAAYKSAISKLAKELGIREKPGLTHLLSLDGVLEIEKKRNNNRYWQILETTLHDAAASFVETRAKEGKRTEQDIEKSVNRIESSLEIISSFAGVMENTIKENIKARFIEILDNKYDENRIMAETAVMLVKYTISEEIARLNAHLSEFKNETANNAHPGKKLDFLCQEINREINTIGSKSNILEVSRAVIEMKDALENIREQLRNVE